MKTELRTIDEKIYKELISLLNQVVILLEDNIDIKSKDDFYIAENVLNEVMILLEELKK